MLVDFKRIIRAGLLNFWRNGFVSVASVLVITITLSVIGSLIFFSAVMNTALSQIKEKVDVNVYFTTDASEGDVLSLKRELESLAEVKVVSYTSREEALGQFKDRHVGDFRTLQALEELDNNPLGASLNILAKETSQYASIARFLEDKQEVMGESNVISTINYYQNKLVIDRLSRFIDSTEKLGWTIVAALVLIAVVITFNTMRLAIYTSREEISVMRLVGADKRYIRGPFLVGGFLYGVVSAIIALAIFFPLTIWLGDKTERFFGGLNVFNYYVENFIQISLIILLSGVTLGVGTSYFAVRRYITKKYLKT